MAMDILEQLEFLNNGGSNDDCADFVRENFDALVEALTDAA
jgi:hypothetical protein